MVIDRSSELGFKFPQELADDKEFMDLWTEFDAGRAKAPPEIWVLIAEGLLPPPSYLRQKCEVFSRVMGYLRPVKDWNKGKQSEFSDRREGRVYQELPGQCNDVDELFKNKPDGGENA